MLFDQGDFGVKKEDFDKVVKKFKSSNKRNYDFLVKSGDSFKETSFKYCKRMFEEGDFPEDFKETVLHMIFKGGKNGRKEILSDSRFIHSKFWLPRLAEGLVVEAGLKQPLLANSSRYQIGGQPGHRPEELLFAWKSVVARMLAEGRLVIGQFYDLSKYFDKEVLADTMDVLARREVDLKAYRLWAKLNETVIQVRTGVGTSEKAAIGEVIGQGTVGGALVSQASLDDGIMAQFEGGSTIAYGSVELLPFQFQDDFENISDSVLSARVTNKRVDVMAKEKRLSLNKDKSVCLAMGSIKQKEEVRRELEVKPLMCGDFKTKLVECDKWLWDWLHSGGLGESCHETVKQREGKVRGGG